MSASKYKRSRLRVKCTLAGAPSDTEAHTAWLTHADMGAHCLEKSLQDRVFCVRLCLGCARVPNIPRAES